MWLSPTVLETKSLPNHGHKASSNEQQKEKLTLAILYHQSIFHTPLMFVPLYFSHKGSKDHIVFFSLSL